MKKLIRIPASQAYVIDRCPGSLEFESRPYPMEVQSEDAKKGDIEHKKITDSLLETGSHPSVEGFLPIDPLLFIEQVFRSEIDGYELYSRPDIIAVTKEKMATLYILDLKTGYSDVTEMDPLQNIIAAFNFLSIYGPSQAFKIKRVICRFIGTETRLSTYDVFSPDEIKARIKEFLNGVKKGAKAKKAILTTGSHCRFCARRTACPKLQKVLKEFANPKLRGIPVEELPVDLIRILPVADKIIDDFRKKLKQRLQDGILSNVAGVSLKYQNAPRSWDMSVDAETLASVTGKPVEVFLDSSIKTVKQVVDEYPELEPKLSRFITQGKQARLVISE